MAQRKAEPQSSKSPADRLSLFCAAILATQQADMAEAAADVLGVILRGAIALKRTRMDPATCMADTEEIIARVAPTRTRAKRRRQAKVVPISAGMDAMQLGRQWSESAAVELVAVKPGV